MFRAHDERDLAICYFISIPLYKHSYIRITGEVILVHAIECEFGLFDFFIEVWCHNQVYFGMGLTLMDSQIQKNEVSDEYRLWFSQEIMELRDWGQLF